ncbi:MAG: cobalamin-dependent protein [Treponema sp.]|jgi:methanogenic corrinoid protein MtbC1|nr:cobalamin-dependent protein [Treponema sp.]
MSSFDDLKNAMGNLDEDEVTRILGELTKPGGGDAGKALAACQEGMSIVGGKFETGEYFVADLIYAGDLMSDAAAALKPLLAGGSGARLGKMVLATVKGDIHDIGKNIVKAILEAGGIEVIDLGVDVAPEAIVEAAKKNGAKIVGLSGVLTLAIDSMKATVDAFKADGSRDKVKIIIGGAPVTANYCAQVGADAWTLNAAESAEICRKWLA